MLAYERASAHTQHEQPRWTRETMLASTDELVLPLSLGTWELMSGPLVLSGWVS